MPPFVSPARSSGLLLDPTAACTPTLLLRRAPQSVLRFSCRHANQATSGIRLPGRFAEVKEEPEGRGTRSKTSGQPEP